MADIKSPEERSQNMSKIRSRDTIPEVWLRKLLFSHGYRYRKNVKTISGKPDIWLAKYKTAVFVHGCFWHRHQNCRFAYTPKSHIDFWNEKFRANTERDRTVSDQLLEKGIRKLIVWECTITRTMTHEDERENLVNQIHDFLLTDEMNLEL